LVAVIGFSVAACTKKRCVNEYGMVGCTGGNCEYNPTGGNVYQNICSGASCAVAKAAKNKTGIRTKCDCKL